MVDAWEMRSTKPLWLCALVLPTLEFLSLTMVFWPGPAFLAPVARLVYIHLAVLIGIFLLPAAAVASIVFAVYALDPCKPAGGLHRAMSGIAACLCFIGLFFTVENVAPSFRERAVVRAVEQGNQIVEALACYRRTQGEYPERLEALVPGYVSRTPHTGMIGFPEFVYVNGRQGDKPAPQGYELRIDMPKPLFSLDQLTYWPSKEYPDELPSAVVYRIDGWMYTRG